MVDIDAAGDFLRLLAPKTSKFTFQTFDDDKSRNDLRLGRTFHGNLADYADKLSDLNQRGAGISVTINETDLKGRKKDNIVRVRAIWQEDDDGWKGEFPLEPSIVVESSAGKFHRYWLVEDGDDAFRQIFPFVMERMVSDYGSDRGASDISRALRLPGFFHRKGADWLVRTASGDGRRYFAQEIVDAFPPVEDDVRHDFQSYDPDAFEAERIRDALTYLDSGGWRDWMFYGWAIYDACQGSEEGKEIWDEWSAASPKFDPKAQEKLWAREFPRGRSTNPITLASIFWEARNAGWEDRVSPEGIQFLPKAEVISGGSLASDTMADLRDTFARWGHSPSNAQWDGLENLVSHLDAMANGTAKPRYFVSSLDPGVGKTQSVTHFIRRLLKSEAHRDVAAILCVSRIAEIKSLVDEMGLDETDYAIHIYDNDANRELLAKGNQNLCHARVLFTTQQMLERHTRYSSTFKGLTKFHYRGRPRQVRLWDEACHPARGFAMVHTIIQGMTHEAAKVDRDAVYNGLEELIDAMKSVDDETLLRVPEFDTMMSEDEADELFQDQSDETREAVRNLWRVSGRHVIVNKIGREKVFVHHEPVLPDDLKPVVICDASARVSGRYKHWSEGRGDLVQLQTGAKSYKNLTINIWRKGGGKASWKNDDGTLIRGVLEAVNSKPTEGFLILHHKQGKKLRTDIPAKIKAGAINPDRLRFAHWGGSDYKATNEFRDIKNIILAGTLFYGEAAYKAIARASLGMRSEERLKKRSWQQIELGEHADLILQALCRGNVRKSVNDGCGDCEAWIIASERSGIPRLLEDDHIFPQSKVRGWEPGGEATIQATVVEYLVKSLLPESKQVIREIELRKAVAGDNADQSNFNKILIQDGMQQKLSLAGIGFRRQRGPLGNYFYRL